MATPGLVKPVRHGGHLLVDGGAVNPLPFDHLIGRADLLVAVDVTGGAPSPQPTHAPGGFATMFGTLQIMQGAIVAAKLKLHRPEIVVRPAVDRFRVLDFSRRTPSSEPLNQPKRGSSARLSGIWSVALPCRKKVEDRVRGLHDP